MLVKVCGLKYGANIKEVLELNPDFVGFNFYSLSPRYVNDETLNDLHGIAFGKTKKVGVFVNEDLEKIFSVAEQYGLEYIQLHGNETAEEAKSLRKHFKVIKAVGIETEEDMRKAKEFDDACDYILLDKKSAAYGGTGLPFEWKLIEFYSASTPFLLGGGLSPGNIDQAKSTKHPKFIGIDLNSGFEDSPGMKNIEKLNAAF